MKNTILNIGLIFTLVFLVSCSSSTSTNTNISEPTSTEDENLSFISADSDITSILESMSPSVGYFNESSESPITGLYSSAETENNVYLSSSQDKSPDLTDEEDGFIGNYSTFIKKQTPNSPKVIAIPNPKHHLNVNGIPKFKQVSILAQKLGLQGKINLLNQAQPAVNFFAGVVPVVVIVNGQAFQIFVPIVCNRFGACYIALPNASLAVLRYLIFLAQLQNIALQAAGQGNPPPQQAPPVISPIAPNGQCFCMRPGDPSQCNNQTGSCYDCTQTGGLAFRDIRSCNYQAGNGQIASVYKICYTFKPGRGCVTDYFGKGNGSCSGGNNTYPSHQACVNSFYAGLIANCTNAGGTVITIQGVPAQCQCASGSDPIGTTNPNLPALCEQTFKNHCESTPGAIYSPIGIPTPGGSCLCGEISMPMNQTAGQPPAYTPAACEGFINSWKQGNCLTTRGTWDPAQLQCTCPADSELNNENGKCIAKVVSFIDRNKKLEFNQFIAIEENVEVNEQSNAINSIKLNNVEDRIQ